MSSSATPSSADAPGLAPLGGPPDAENDGDQGKTGVNDEAPCVRSGLCVSSDDEPVFAAPDPEELQRRELRDYTGLSVEVSPARGKRDYEEFTSEFIVREVLREIQDARGLVRYEVLNADGDKLILSYKKRRTGASGDEEIEDAEEEESEGAVQRSSSTDSLPFVVSDLYPPSKAELARMKRGNYGPPRLSKGPAKSGGSTNRRARSERAQKEGMRRSDRSGRVAVSMLERGEDDIWASGDDTPAGATSRAVGVREVFKALPRTDSFRHIHYQQCDSCDAFGDSEERGPLVFCQGCTISYHKSCLGPRNQRDHLVTKVGEKNFVLQCRRCIRSAEKKDPLAPRLDICQLCKEPGLACKAFREKKTAKQEEKEREENGGEDPTTVVAPSLLNNVRNVQFRCGGCHRAFHFHHLPPLSGEDKMDIDGEDLADKRYEEYRRDWRCRECVLQPAKAEGLVAWRPVNVEAYVSGETVDMVNEDAKEYLVKWEKRSYFRTLWMPGAWVWGVTPTAMRKAFARRNNGSNLPQMNTEDAIPEEFLRIDIVLDVRYTSIVSIHTEEVDKARIREVDQALVKFKGLGYEEVVWENVPGPEDGDRWKDYVMAYEDWVAGRYIHQPKQHYLKERLEKVKSMNFQSKLLKKKQPENLTGGELMGYQMEGLNWAYYKWYKGQNAILADEMGLGKTIQVIGLLATLVQDHKCWPFLVVVPNSTCPNWRREIKQWAPSLRVVTYYGSAEARKIAMEHELYPDRSKDLKCHIVITSYEAPADESSRKFFRNVHWAGLIVDEGQRLKNDKNLLYGALSALKAPFKLLLTGTPLQNNARELFNLLQFLDDSIDASQLDEDYAQLTKENVPKLHDLIRPFFLRRTKAQVLTFLPPMAQVIIPVTMSLVQKKLYKSILAKNPELIKSIFGRQKLKQTERHNLNNILMQLRKCLCHPFVYSEAIEERSANAATSHRTLVEASSKLQLLETMLPKLKERGHRVLIFSQFLAMLDIIEDFLDGLGLPFQRLDGTIGTLQKQKRIDAFNAPDSPLFAFLLSTRAGGVGINLATADTVLIMDPDFNPHQDIQALSRAHRIGQKKKVLVFQLMTRDSAEEKIVQAGRKKMALDHVLVEQMDAGDDAGEDLESILMHGAAALFSEDDKHDIHYDSAAVDKLLDRSQAENTKVGEDSSAESQFSFARIWANDRDVLEEGFKVSEMETKAPDPTVWDMILNEREQNAAKERAARQETLGRGKRRRQAVEYNDAPAIELGENLSSPARPRGGSNSDTDFRAKDAGDEEDDEEVSGEEADEGPDGKPSKQVQQIRGHAAPVQVTPARKSTRIVLRPLLTVIEAPPAAGFTRAKLPARPAIAVFSTTPATLTTTAAPDACPACNLVHPVGHCALKLAGVEMCPLCGLAHYGEGPTCPHLKSETQVRAMMDAIRRSAEDRETKEAALVYLRGRKGQLVRKKKIDADRAAAHRPGNVSVDGTLLATGQGPPPPPSFLYGAPVAQPQPGHEGAVLGPNGFVTINGGQQQPVLTSAWPTPNGRQNGSVQPHAH
ncbi:MAG: hypothetical protein M1832_002597 [Thelocarpon impressellum]|nr:MAG: hypothetical protein M1832_002597 [Thelocarpon impressellum]